MSSLNYEVACQIFGQLIAHEVSVIAREESQQAANLARVAAANAERRALVAARDALPVDDEIVIAQAITDYGLRARKLVGRIAL
ncbi:hypothetical protein EFP18_30025 (plasmid) [Burkholderia glumae]|uniref:hypothetical protein n=1 Tax=Burkholderia glumae TaxID=337 RepID=UPI0021509557|nr:hypothetical protein [Burkholderia glumae]UVS88314.1 hypothetical protein EFP18_30025 [Burkholderia glumae]